MRAVFGLVLLIGIGLAGFAVYVAQGYIAQTQAELARERAAKARAVPTVDVYVVKKNLAYGDVLTKDDVQKIAWPANALPEKIFKDEAALFPPTDSRPRIVTVAMSKYEPLLSDKVTKPGEDAGLTTRLAKGMRAFAIKVDVASGVSGFLRPGDKVDVYWTGAQTGPGGSPGDEVTRLIQAAITIIAVDQTAETSNSTSTIIARTVTVQATPEQVAVLAQAQSSGRLALSLVGNGDDMVTGEVQADSRSLLGLTNDPPPQPEPAAVEPPKPKVCTIKQRSGSTVIEVPIPCTN